MALATLTGLWVYPVKSCRGLARTAVRVTAHGLEHDREWLIVNPAGQCLTQREDPRLALIETELHSDRLELRAPGRTSLKIPLVATGRLTRPATVWGETMPATDEGDAAAAWLGTFLGGDFRLVRWDPAQRRPTDPAWTGGEPAEVYFGDAFPFLVLGEETWSELNGRLWPGPPVPLDRFRTNLLLTGLGVAGEDTATMLRGEVVEFRLVKPCIRCVMTTTDQQTGQRHHEPLRTLAKYRRDPRFSAPVFGQNAILIRGAGDFLSVGDRFEAA
jgi:uncharacterized protein YcbX